MGLRTRFHARDAVCPQKVRALGHARPVLRVERRRTRPRAFSVINDLRTAFQTVSVKFDRMVRWTDVRALGAVGDGEPRTLRVEPRDSAACLIERVVGQVHGLGYVPGC